MKISVALCTYNGSKYLNQQIDNILNQTIPVDEIIVCDDQSKDDTVFILNNYKNKNPELFHIHINIQNLKSNKNFEKAIKLCTGVFIFLSDQDDLWRNDKVEKTLEIFNKNPTIEGVFSNAKLIDEGNKELLFKNNKVTLWDTIYFFESKMKKPIDLYKLLLLKSNFLTGATLCIKKEVKCFCFPFQTKENISLHDEWFALILSQRNTLSYSTEELISYRIHSEQQMGEGLIEKNIELLPKIPKSQKFILELEKPRTFKDFRKLYKEIKNKYVKFQEINKINPNDFHNIKNELKLLDLYKQTDLI